LDNLINRAFSKKVLLLTIILLTLSFLSLVCQTSISEKEILEKATKIHERTLLLDTHVDIEGELYGTEKYDPGIDNPNLRCDLVKMKQGGVDGVFLIAFSQQKPEFDEKAYENADRKVMGYYSAINRVLQMYPDRCELAVSPADVIRISKTGKRAIMIGLENGYPIGNDLTRVKKYYDLGTRYIGLCHWNNNQICDASTAKKPKNNGLSDFGKQVVAEMNLLGIMCDASHSSDQTLWDLLKTSKAPVVLTHSGCYALTPHPRNINDELLKALAKNDGVIQIVAVDGFIETAEHKTAIKNLRTEMGVPDREDIYDMSKEERKAIQPLLDKFKKRTAEIEKEIPDATITDFVNHIDHAVKVAGINHVGIGSDFDGGGGFQGFENHSEALNITIELVRRGYSEEDIKKIYGGNLLRVWRAVEDVSNKLSQNNKIK